MWSVKKIRLSADYIMAESRGTGIALRQHCEDILLALPGKSKLLLEVLSHWYREKSISYINSYIPNARNCADLLQ